MRSKSVDLMRQIVDYVDKRYKSAGRVPTYREIANELSITSSCVSNYMKEMQKRGMISNQAGSRGIVTQKMKKTDNEIYDLPVVGSIACGTPLFAEENIERYVQVPKFFVGKGEFFILVAHGDSMVNANIENGDYVIVKKQDTAEEGQIIVALLDNEATLKRYFLDKKNKKVRLHPENDDMEDMYFPNVVIQGVAVKVIKDLN